MERGSRATALAVANATAEHLGLIALVELFNRTFHSEMRPEGLGFYAGTEFLHVRVLTEQDSAPLKEFLQHGLSEESRRTRFLTSTPRITSSAAAYLASRDGRDRVALVATTISPVGEETIVAMAEYATYPTHSDENIPPEVAIAVSDAYQGKRVGRQLISMLATLSIAGGYNQWSADFVSTNGAVAHTLSSVGHVRTVGDSSGIKTVIVDLDPAKVFN